MLFQRCRNSRANPSKPSDVAEIKRLGRLVAGYDDHVWNGVRQIEVYEGLLAKFSQNAELGAQLVA